MDKESAGDRPRVGQRVVLRLLGALSPRLYALLRKGMPGRLARKLLDVVAPAGDDVVATVRGGPLKGARLRLDPRKQKEMVLGSYEPEVQKSLRRFAGEGDTVFDIGAHLGFFTLLASRVVGPSGRVVALEPDPSMSEKLSANLGLNGQTNITWQKAAVGQKAGQMTFSPGLGGGIGHLSETGTLTVEVTSLDDLARQWGAPRLIKVDVEGGELDVLAGAETVLRDHRPVWIVEAHGPANEAAAASLFQEHGYDISFLNDVSGRKHLLAIHTE